MNFIGREEELKVLEREYLRDAGFVVIYGRRRVGKTTMIKQFIKNKNALYFLANEENDRQNLNRFTAKISEFLNQPYFAETRFVRWQDAFLFFASSNHGEKKVLVIDEFQYLVQANSAFPSIFQEAWDEVLKNKNIMVILCGSHISMMTSTVLSHSSPLYGRRTAQIRLKPLDFLEFSSAFPDKSFEERTKIFSVSGGVPKYIEFFSNNLTLEENINDNILNKSGFLYEEPVFLLEKEVRETVNYFSIMRAVAMGNHKLSEIANALEQKTNHISPYLNILSDLFLIEKRVPATENEPEKSRRGLYYINDNFLEFWFKFVYPYKSEIELDNYTFVLEKLRRNFIDNHVSFIYERVCTEIFLNLCKTGKIDFNVSRIGSYWNTKSTVQIDVVAIDENNKRIFAGECKFYNSNKPVDMNVYADLIRKCAEVPEFKGYEIVYGIFSKSGFDKRLKEIGINSRNVILIDELHVLP